MAPNFASAKLTLSCPLFAADFDPRNDRFLLVGGGGGEGRSGVKNKISLLDTSKRNQLSEIVDIELSREEDSVMSLAVLQRNDDSLVALAGINSSQAEQQRGKNQHLRSFKIDFPHRNQPPPEEAEETKGASTNHGVAHQLGKTTPLSRVSLFRTRTERADTYQRLLRLSPPVQKENKEVRTSRIAVIATGATGLTPAGEIVFFDATNPSPTAADVIGRIQLANDEEAQDVDLVHEHEDDQFRLAYTDGSGVYICEASSQTRSNTSPDVHCVYKIPPPSGKERARPKFRSLRFVSRSTLLLLQNASNRAGCELLLLALPASASSLAKEVRRKTLRRTMKGGSGLDMCTVGVDAQQQQAEHQCLIAVSGYDQSIELLTLNYAPTRGYGKFQLYTSLRGVHPFSITKICFSTFNPSAAANGGPTGQPRVKLASVSMGNTVVVHTLPLSTMSSCARATTPRYVLAGSGRSEVLQSASSGFAALLIIAIACFLLQAFAEIRGGVPPYLGAREWLSPRLCDMIARPYIFDNFEPNLSERLLKPHDQQHRHHDLPASSSTSSPSSTVPSLHVPHRSLRDLLRARKADLENVPNGENNGNGRAVPSLSVVVVRYDGLNLLVEETQTPGSGSGSEGAKIDSDSNSKSESGSEFRGRIQHPSWEELADEERKIWKQRLIDAGHWVAGESETILEGVLFAEYAGLVGNVVEARLT